MPLWSNYFWLIWGKESVLIIYIIIFFSLSQLHKLYLTFDLTLIWKASHVSFVSRIYHKQVLTPNRVISKDVHQICAYFIIGMSSFHLSKYCQLSLVCLELVAGTACVQVVRAIYNNGQIWTPGMFLNVNYNICLYPPVLNFRPCA